MAKQLRKIKKKRMMGVLTSPRVGMTTKGARNYLTDTAHKLRLKNKFEKFRKAVLNDT